MSSDYEEHIRAVSASLEDLKDVGEQMRSRFAQLLMEVNAALRAAGLPSGYELVWEEKNTDGEWFTVNNPATYPFGHDEHHFAENTGNCICSCARCGPFDRCICTSGCKGTDERHVHWQK